MDNQITIGLEDFCHNVHYIKTPFFAHLNFLSMILKTNDKLIEICHGNIQKVRDQAYVLVSFKTTINKWSIYENHQVQW